MLGNKNRANSMSASEQETQQISEDWEVGEESQQQEQEIGQQTENEENETPAEAVHLKQKRNERKRRSTLQLEHSSFVHGLATGLGIGCIAAFVMLWLTVFFTPQLPSGITYEVMLSTFIYPIIYLFALGLIALTVGIVGEHYAVKSRV
jgi:cation transport ATPase